MKKNKLSLDRRVIRQLSPRDLRETAGGGWIRIPPLVSCMCVSCFCVPPPDEM